MNHLILPVITASALIFGFILPSEEAAAQTTARRCRAPQVDRINCHARVAVVPATLAPAPVA